MEDDEFAGVTLYPCPLPECPWMESSFPTEVESQPDALAAIFGIDVFSVLARNARMQEMESKIKSHLHTHSVEQFAVALANANKRIEELEMPKNDTEAK